MESNATDHSGELTTQSKVPYNPLIIAHRGYSSLFPDNTMESIEAGLYKADYVEFDILTTKDN
jgi:glycerophosphoryl diester phosphodiesterase